MVNTKRLIVLGTVCFSLIYTYYAEAQTVISSIGTSVVTGTESEAIVTSPSNASNDINANENYTLKYGVGNDIFVQSYTISDFIFDNFLIPDTLVLNRRIINDRLVNIWYTLITDPEGVTTLEIDPTAATDADAIYLTGILNGGYDNILVNEDELASGSIPVETERIDVIWNQGIQTSSPSTAVFPIIERGGDDNVAIAAITSLNPDGTPATYGTLIGIPETFWPQSGSTFNNYLILRRETTDVEPIPLLNIGTFVDQGSQTVQGVAVSFSELGILANQSVFGYSLFPADVCDEFISNTGDVLSIGTQTIAPGIVLNDISTFPLDTKSNDSGLDLVAGVSAAVSNDDNLIETKGPGGYKAALATWLKANDGAFVTNTGTASTEGNDVGFWEDQAIGNHDFITLGDPPTFRSTSSTINFNPTVDFLNGQETGLQTSNNEDFNVKSSGNSGYKNKSINIAFRTPNSVESLNNKQQLYEQGGGTNGIGIYISDGDLHMSVWNKTSQPQGDWNDFGIPVKTLSDNLFPDTEYIATLEFEGDETSSGDGEIRGFLNGQQIGSLADPYGQNIGLLYNHGGEIGLGQHNGASLYDDNDTEGDAFYGEVSEFIYRNEPSSFSIQQRNQIESYLAIKYGITLDQSTPINYFNAHGDIIFDATNNASIGGFLEYNNDIAGIGRDDASELDQPASRSENKGSIVTIDRGSTISTDDTWLIWGNDAGSLTPNRTETKPETINERLPRVWRVSETKEVQTTAVSFDLTGLGLSTNATDFSLLVAGNSSNANFNNATVISGGVYDGPTNTITFTGVDIDDGEYFTLGTSFFICTPGNVQDGLSLWLKADAEAFSTGTTLATNGQAVVSWGDQSRNNFDANEDTNRNPTWVANDVNFNPGLNFPDDEGSNEIGFNLGSNYIFAEDEGGGMHIFTAVEPIDAGTNVSTRQQKMIYNFGDRNNAHVGLGTSTLRGTIQVPSDNNNFTISPNASEFILEGDYDINAGEFDTHAFLIDGEEVRTETFSYQLNDAAITQASTHSENSGPVSIGRISENNDIDSNDGRRYYGDIQEVIVYNEEITDLQAQQVRSYLSFKYGTTLTNDNNANLIINETISGEIQEGDYVASNGNTITFDYSEDTNFVTNIAGIGRDDDTCLEQKQSRSVNSDAILTIGLGEIASNNANNTNSFDNDLDFFTWGSNGDLTTFADRTTGVTGIGTVTERMTRIWRAQDNGNVGATDISFDLSGLGYTGSILDYQLIVSPNSSLSSPIIYQASTLASDVLTFNDIDIPDRYYFTIGVAREACGPGGVTGNMVLWLRADLGTNTTIDNNPVTSWSDQSVAANNASDDFSANIAGPAPPSFTEVGTNFNPHITFETGSGEFMVIDDDENVGSGLNPNAHALFIAGTMNTASEQFAPFICKTQDYDWQEGWALAENGTSLIYHKDESNNASPDQVSSVTFNDGIPSIYSAFTDDSIDSLKINNGSPNGTVAANFDAYTTQPILIGSTMNANNNGVRQHLDGNIGDLVMYDATLTVIQRRRIATYLAVKYGITLDNTAGGTNGDYENSNGVTIWDASDYSTYHNDVAGIGRDDASCFAQKQSSSINSGEILTIGLGNVATSNLNNLNHFDDDGDFLLWGNDGGSTLQSAAQTSDVPATVSERMTRVWRVEETGNVGATEIEFDLTGLGYQTDASNFRLIVAESGSGGTMSEGSLIDGGTFNGNILAFSGIDLADGEYFTLGTALTTCGPGGVNTNISVWFRADKEAYSDLGTTLANDGENMLQWGDQSSPNIDALELDLGGGASAIEPTFETNEFNFNPTLRFTDPNSNNSSYFQTASTAVTGDFTLISIFKTGQAQGTDEDVLNSPALISARNEGTDDYSMGIQGGTIWLDANSDNGFEVQTTGTYNDNQVHIVTSVKSETALNLFVDSENVGSGTGSATLGSATGYGIGNHFNSDLQAQFAGDIAETIVFSSALSETEQARVESYLAIKYGLTRNISGLSEAEEDYLAADGDIVWNVDLQDVTYYNDIFGIARDDLSCLNQTQSQSESDDALVTFNILGGFVDNDSYLLSGNDNAAIEDENNNEVPTSLNINSRLNREWRVQETGNVGTIELTYDMASITGPLGIGTNNLGFLRLLVDDDGDFSNGGTVAIGPSFFNGTDNTVTFEVDFTNGQYYTLGSEEKAALPVELLSFEANAQDDLVTLTWATISEINNAFFSIERSANGINYKTIANLDGAGNSQGVINYEYVDRNPLDGFSFYRLKQTDFSGELDYSEVLSVYVKRSALIKIDAFPNPIMKGEILELNHSLRATQQAILRVFDLGGRVSLSQKIEIDPTRPTIYISTNSMSKGINLVKLILSDGMDYTFKVLVR